MKFQTYTGITWSDLELTGLIEDELSLVLFERFKKHLGLHPFHLTNLNAALNEILSSNLNSYDNELKGFLLAYKNPKLLTPLGEILYDTCFIHVDIEADFYIFRPEVGCSLKGTVNKKGLDHIGLLVHKAFNVSIPKQDDDDDWPGDDLAIGQDVHFVVTCLDITGGLPYIRGALDSNEYSQAKLRRQKQNETSSSDNKPAKQQSFFPTDSEHSSNEDTPQALKETPKQKRSKKRYEPEELIEHHETKKEEKKRTKKAKEVKESKPKLITTECEQEQYVNNVSTNGTVKVDLEETITPKKRARKKTRDHSSQSSVDEYDNEKSEKYSPKKALKALPHMGSRDEKSDVEIKYCASNSDSEQVVGGTTHESKIKSKKGSNKLPNSESKEEISNIKLEESMANSDLDQSESKIKSKKKSTKIKHLDGDTSTDDFTSDKYIKNANKKSKRKTKMVDTETEEVNIKTENLNDLYIDEVNIVAESPSKKKHKIHKNSLTLETSESEVHKQHTEKASTKRRSKKLSISECEFPIGSIKVKTERFSGSENTQDEDHEKTNKLSPRKLNSKAAACSSNVEEESEDNTVQKKRKKRSKKSLIDTSEIKIEPEFEVIVKKEKSDSATENISQKSPQKSTSPRKKRKVELNDDIANETDQENVTHLKKNKVTDTNTKTHDVNIKTEKSITNHALDEDMSDPDKRHNRKGKNRGKDLPKKQSNKSREFLSDTDFSDVEIKFETSVNS